MYFIIQYSIIELATRPQGANQGEAFFLGDVYGKAIFNYSTTNSAVKK